MTETGESGIEEEFSGLTLEESLPQTPRLCNQLFLGEASFSFTVAFLRKHNTFVEDESRSLWEQYRGERKHHSLKYLKLAGHVLATEFNDESDLAVYDDFGSNKKCLEEEFRLNFDELSEGSLSEYEDDEYDLCRDLRNLIQHRLNVEKKGVFATGISASQLGDLLDWKKYGLDPVPFQRIHFNFPMSTCHKQDDLLKDIFAAAKAVQDVGNRVYLAAPSLCPGNTFYSWTKSSSTDESLSYVSEDEFLSYAQKACYCLVKKKEDVSCRCCGRCGGAGVNDKS